MLVPHQNGFHAVLVRQLQQQLHGFIQLAFQPPPGGKHREKSTLLQLCRRAVERLVISAKEPTRFW